MSEQLRLIDTHAHLAIGQFDGDRAAALARAADAGVARIVEVGFDLASSRAALALAEAHPQVFAVVGVQPNYAHALPDSWEAELRALCAHSKAVALGEIGLDYHWMQAPPAEQEALFRAQLALARELAMPVVIHSREAQADTLRVLGDAARGMSVVMHSFSGDWAYAEACLELGFTLSLSGPVTFPKAAELHEVARRAPLERLLSETDSPYLSPHPHRGQRNEPARVGLVVERIAALRGQPPAAVADQIWSNAEAIFPRTR